MGEVVEHTLSRVECKRKAEDITNYGLSYNIDIPRREIKKKLLHMGYVFHLIYSEDIGEIIVEGDISYKDTQKALKDIEKNWDTNMELRNRVFNIIFRNSVVMVMDIARHVGLPPPINIPKLTTDEVSG